MNKYKRIGIILILIGVCIPLVAFIFAIGYEPKMGFWWSVPNMNIILWQKHLKLESSSVGSNIQKPMTYEEAIDIVPPEDLPIEALRATFVLLPYKFPFSLGIILLLSGIGLFVLAKPKKNEK